MTTAQIRKLFQPNVSLLATALFTALVLTLGKTGKGWGKGASKYIRKVDLHKFLTEWLLRSYPDMLARRISDVIAGVLSGQLRATTVSVHLLRFGRSLNRLERVRGISENARRPSRSLTLIL